jgi:NTE family protein
LLRGRLFRERLDALLPCRAFEACRAEVALSVFAVRARRTEVLARGDLAAAIHASCAVPLLFHPVTIDGRSYLDGGILDRPGLLGMPASQERVLFHHIASRSAWRTTLDVPRRPGMVTVVLEDLPRSGPFRLEAGRAAFRAARAAMMRALDQPLGEIVRVAA